jgi:hypothetical protein
MKLIRSLWKLFNFIKGQNIKVIQIKYIIFVGIGDIGILETPLVN